MKISSSIITISALLPLQYTTARIGRGSNAIHQLNAHDARESRIVGGHEANAKNYPFFVEWSLGCGAALIYEDIALTAAHCLEGIWNKDVWIGSQDSRDGLYNSIAATSPHPKYDTFTMEYDIMVIKLSESVPSSIKPVQLNIDSSNPSTGDYLTVIGHGDVEPGRGTGSDTLQEVNIPFVPHNVCESQYGQGEVLENVMFCAGETGKDSCQGDSGGPILDSNGVLVGITSWGLGCGDEGFPGIYARVSFVHDWIQEQICLHSANPPSACGDRTRVQLKFLFDNYPHESQWSLTDNQLGENLLFQGQNVQSGEYSMGVNLKSGSYSFEIKDLQRDGLCCSYGEGSYSIASGGTSIDRNGEFAGEDRVVFLLDEYGQLTEIGTGSLPHIPLPIADFINPGPTGTTPPPPLPPQNPVFNNNNNLVQLRVDIKYDEYPRETAWMLINQDSGEQMHLSQYNQVQEEDAQLSTHLNVPNGRYWFILMDEFNDGICCDYGSGWATIYQLSGSSEDILVHDEGEFQGKSDHFFVV